MSADLERDLGAWAAGVLSRERLVATHGAEAAGTVAVHDRLTELAGGMPIPDAEAGWAALVARIEAPAPVSLLIAAAVMVGGSAFAAVRSWTRHDPVPSRPSQVVTDVGRTFGPSDRGLVPLPAPTAPAHDGRPSPRTHRGHVGSDATGPSGTGGSPSADDPNDRDQGTGNDGSHDDQGGGNDGPSGSGQDGQGGNQGASGDQQGGSQGQDSQ